jgi:ABC-2 type transport system permease protein
VDGAASEAVPPSDQELYPGEFTGVNCADIAYPTANEVLNVRFFSFHDEMPGRAIAIAAMLALAGYLVAASFVGAEWQHGTMGGLLLWEPRRVRVFLAKLFALFTGLTLVGAVTYALGLGGHWLVAHFVGETAGADRAFQESLAISAARGIALSLVIAACGFAIAYTFRLTAAALGVAIAYVVGAEMGLRIYNPESQRWLLTENITAWLQNGARISIYDCADPSNCTERVVTLTMWQGGAYVAGLALVLAVIAGVIFARRDVT